MLFPKFVPSCSQPWALFCIWNIRNALLHSLSHLDTLICKGCKEHENTAGTRTYLQCNGFYSHCRLSHGCKLGCSCLFIHTLSSWLLLRSFFNKQKLHYIHVKVFSWLLSTLAAFFSARGEMSQLHPILFSCLVQIDQFSQSFSICAASYPPLVSPKGLPLSLAVFRANAE